MRRVGFLAAGVVVTLLVAATLLGGLRLGGARPDLLVLVVVAVAMVSGPTSGAAFGFAAGLVADLLLDLPVGVSAFVYTVVGFAVGLARTYVVRTNALVHMTLAASASLVSVWLSGLILRLMDLSSWGLVARSGLLVAGFNLLVTPLVYPVVRALAGRYLAERVYRW